MRNRRLVRIRPGGVRIAYPPIWTNDRVGAGSIGKSLGWLLTTLFGPTAEEVRP